MQLLRGEKMTFEVGPKEYKKRIKITTFNIILATKTV